MSPSVSFYPSGSPPLASFCFRRATNVQHEVATCSSLPDMGGFLALYLAQPTFCRHLGHPTGVSGTRQAPKGLTHIVVSGMSSGGWEDDNCLLQTSLLRTLAHAQGTQLELPNLFFSDCTQVYPQGESHRSPGSADGGSLYELSCQTEDCQQRTSIGTGFPLSTGLDSSLLTALKAAAAKL